jgi:hypothetical protein
MERKSGIEEWGKRSGILGILRDLEVPRFFFRDP